MSERFIYLLRHAKSSRDDPEIADHERPLNPRGLKAAKRIAEHMHHNGLAPTLVLCSSARRARETAAPIQQMLGSRVKIKLEDALYAAGADQLLKRLRRLADSVPSVMIIGHNPGIQQLAVELTGDHAAQVQLAAGFPTAGLATLSVGALRWRELRPGSAELVAFTTPRSA
jgi:phosphohistidine phosphatase